MYFLLGQTAGSTSLPSLTYVFFCPDTCSFFDKRGHTSPPDHLQPFFLVFGPSLMWVTWGLFWGLQHLKKPERLPFGCFFVAFWEDGQFWAWKPSKKSSGLWKKFFIFDFFRNSSWVFVENTLISTLQEEFWKGSMSIDICWFFVFGLDLFTWPALYAT